MNSLFQRPILPDWATSKEAYWSEYFQMLWWALVLLIGLSGIKAFTSACKAVNPEASAKPAGLGWKYHDARNEASR